MARGVDTLVVNGTCVVPQAGLFDTNIAIRDGRIVGLLPRGTSVDAAEVIEARGLHVLPGVIDPQTHLGFMGMPLSDIASETRSAAVGGVTSLLNYVLTPGSYDEAFEEFVGHLEELAYVDIGVHLGVFSPAHVDQVGHAAADLGVSSFRFFMSFKGKEALQRGFTPTDDGMLYEFMREVARNEGAVANIHTENIEVVWRLEEELRAQGLDGLGAYHAARPGFTEADDLLTACYFGQLTGCPLYFLDVSSRETIAEVRQFRDSGEIFVETCPHYLSLTIDAPCGTLAKVNPPVRTSDDVAALWDAIGDGTIDTIGSHHAPLMRRQKVGTIWEVAAAFPGVATLLPVLLHEGYHRRGIGLQRLAELTSYNPARIFNLYPRKGSLQIGADADLTIVDLEREMVVTADYLQSRSDFSPWEGQRLKGWPVQTLVRGQTVMKEGEILGHPGHGVYLHRCTRAIDCGGRAS